MGLLKSTEFIYQYEINNIIEDHAQKAFGKKDYSPTLTQCNTTGPIENNGGCTNKLHLTWQCSISKKVYDMI